MLFRLLSKKYVKDIIQILNTKGEIGFSELKSKLNVDKSYLSRLLCELEDNQIISRKEIIMDRRIPRSYFKLTPLGKKIIQLYELEEKLEKEKSNIIIGDNNIIANNIQNSHISFKK
ncbi:MarR family transcriptional regulator [Methanothermococcus sp.]|uniref:MarR family transcriptional regulator n=1 Tax=Methanothermococcus sp. TaxID=2614238 RepID=UPI0025D84A68|nr:MarR family transcriptional regulator [Methanothermococcus sp.]